MDCSLPGSFVHGISQARILESVAITLSRGSSRPRDRTWLSSISGRLVTSERSGITLLVIVLLYWNVGLSDVNHT